MKQKRMLKNLSSLALAGAVVASGFPQYAVPVFAQDVKTNEVPIEEFATVDELKTFNTDDINDGIKNPAKVYFGNNDQQWWIAGSQQNQGLTLFAASPLANDLQFEPEFSVDKPYDPNWNCNYIDTTEPITLVHADHYGASPLRNKLHELEQSYFTNEEQKMMNDTTIHTDDSRTPSVYATTDKLYLAYGDENDNQYITVGTNAKDETLLNNGLHVDQDYWGNSTFWLRRPRQNDSFYVMIADLFTYQDQGMTLYCDFSNRKHDLVPAFELDLSSVLFASAVPATTGTGNLSLQDTAADGAFTLRYDANLYNKNLGSTSIPHAKDKIQLTNVPNGTYLVVQNEDHAYAKQINGESEVLPNDIDSNLTTFKNCKVWLETTDTTNRMTYAKLADEEKWNVINITAQAGLNVTTNNSHQEVAPNTAIIDIIVEIADGYSLPEGYMDQLKALAWNGLQVVETKNGFTISGTPTSDVNVTLPALFQKVFDMSLDGNGNFGDKCVGYQPLTAQTFTITNTGNMDLKNINVQLTGANADQFTLNWDNQVTTLAPNGTLNVTVAPNNDLTSGSYAAKLSVSASNATTTTADLQFAVNEHAYTSVVTAPTCTNNGYTTYTCQNCNHSYQADEVLALGHQLGEWKVVQQPAIGQTGLKERSCERCDYKETETIPALVPGGGSSGGSSKYDGLPVYRAYNPNSGEHFYTLDKKEFDHIIRLGWNDEGIAFMAETKNSGQKLYRVYNPNSGLHHYTLDEKEKDTLVSLGWKDEDVAWYASTKPMHHKVYRLYNPNDGKHLYTIDEHEKDVLDSIGWNFEGIAFRSAPIQK